MQKLFLQGNDDRIIPGVTNFLKFSIKFEYVYFTEKKNYEAIVFFFFLFIANDKRPESGSNLLSGAKKTSISKNKTNGHNLNKRVRFLNSHLIWYGLANN